MTARTKSILIIAAALCTGILIGALSVGAIVNHRVDQLRQLRQPEGVAAVVENVIRPENEEQRREIRLVLQRAAERNAELRYDLRRRHMALLDSLQADLGDILSPDQTRRLERWVEHERRPMRFRGDGPPPRRGSGRYAPPRGTGPRGGGMAPGTTSSDSVETPGDDS